MKRRAQVPTVYGLNQALVNLMYEPMHGSIAPDGVIQGEIGQMYVRTTDNSVYVATSHVAGVTVWTRIDCNSRALGLTWVVDATVGPIDLAVNHGYILTSNVGAPVVTTLPAASEIGDQIWLNLKDFRTARSGLRINQRAGQYIQKAARKTLVGGAGYGEIINPNNLHVCLSNMLVMVCIEANLGWQVVSSTIDINLHN